MPRRRTLLAAATLAPFALAPRAASTQAGFPSKPITLVVPFAPGGIADITARAVGEAMQAQLKQPVVIDNRPSAGSIVASTAVAKAPADGHTLLLMTNANAVSASLFRKLPYDPVKDFAPVSTLGFFELAIFANADGRHRSLRELLVEARARPGKLTVGTIAVGSTQHLAAELFRTAAGADLLIVPYKGSPAVLTALRSGEIDLAVEVLGPMLPQVKAGAVRALAVAAERRNPALPQVPTAAEEGVARYAVASWNAIAAPAGTPKPVLDALHRAVQAALDAPAVRQRLQDYGVKPQGSTPAEAEALLAREIARWGEVIRAAKIEPQ